MSTTPPTFHCHPQSLDSASTPEAFAAKEVELESGALTCTDHGSMGACIKVYNLAKANGLAPVLGLEGYHRDDSCEILAKNGIPRDDKGTYKKFYKYGHITMHFLDQEAYETGVRILSNAALTKGEKHGSEVKPIFDWKDLEELGSKNVTFGSGCMIGMVQRPLQEGKNPQVAREYYERLRSIVKPGNFYVELFPHVVDRNWVKGIFITLADGSRLKYYDGKKFKTDAADEITAKDLAVKFNRKNNQHTRLIAVKNNKTWEDIEKDIVKVEDVEGFFMNECTPMCPDGDLQLLGNRFVQYFGEHYKDLIVVSDDSHYSDPEYRVVQEVRLGQGGTWKFSNSYHRFTGDESRAYFKNHMGISDKKIDEWFQNNRDWASRFKNFELKYEPQLPTKFFPQDTLKHTMELVEKHGRMDWSKPEYVQRLKSEIELLHKNGKLDLLPYFFISEKVCSLYEEHGLLGGPGRGSSGGMLLAYLLGITHTDPLKAGLSAERFLTLDRIESGKLPDIDQDLPQRELLLEHLEKWFPGHYAQISADTTMKLRSSVKDVARALHGHVSEDIEKLTKQFENAPQGVSDKDHVFGYTAADGWVHGSIERDPALQDYIKRYPDEWRIVQMCMGLSRGKTRHASGYIITNRPISEFIPMQLVGGVPVTQYTAQGVEDVGAVKMDFLVVTSLNDISDALQLIRAKADVPDETRIDGRRVPKTRILPHEGGWLDTWNLSEDQRVFADIARGDTVTVFQFNTNSAVKYLRYFDFEKSPGKRGIDSINSMAVFTALDRPGPLDITAKAPDGTSNNMLVEYARRLRGLPPAKTPQIFWELCHRTQGLVCFQESLQLVYQHLTGCTGAEAEQFRRDVAKKKVEKVQKAYPFYMEKASAKIGEPAAKEAWDYLQTWANYGFCMAHAQNYCVISYACAFLKHHYPLEWWTAVLRNAKKNEVNEKFWDHCGHLVDLPDINLSGQHFEIQDGRIRAPIGLILGIGDKAQEQLVAGRPYRDIDDFCQKIQQYRVNNCRVSKATGKTIAGVSALNRRVVRTLIVSGVMNSLFPEGTDLYNQVVAFEDALSRATGCKPSKKDIERYKNLDPLVIYQTQKAVLPEYSMDVLPHLKQFRGVIFKEDKVEYSYRGNQLKFINGKEFQILNQSPVEIMVAGAGYVEEWREFKYDGGNREALAVTLDICGQSIECVKWGREQSGLPQVYKTNRKGAICLVVFNKYKSSRPFVIEEIITIREPAASTEEPDTL